MYVCILYVYYTPYNRILKCFCHLPSEFTDASPAAESHSQVQGTRPCISVSAEVPQVALDPLVTGGRWEESVLPPAVCLCGDAPGVQRGYAASSCDVGGRPGCVWILSVSLHVSSA